MKRYATKLMVLAMSVIIVSCAGRKMSSNEMLFMSTLQRGQVDYSKVKIHNFDNTDKKVELAMVEVAKAQDDELQTLGEVKTKVTRQEVESFVVADPDAVTIGNQIFFRKRYFDDFLIGYPHVFFYGDAALFAHEMTHVWQSQNRKRTGYSLPKVIREHLRYKNPYQYQPLVKGKKFIEYRYEQQGQMVQDYIELTYDGQSYNEKLRLQLEVLIEREYSLKALISSMKISKQIPER